MQAFAGAAIGGDAQNESPLPTLVAVLLFLWRLCVALVVVAVSVVDVVVSVVVDVVVVLVVVLVWSLKLAMFANKQLMRQQISTNEYDQASKNNLTQRKIFGYDSYHPHYTLQNFVEHNNLRWARKCLSVGVGRCIWSSHVCLPSWRLGRKQLGLTREKLHRLIPLLCGYILNVSSAPPKKNNHER